MKNQASTRTALTATRSKLAQLFAVCLLSVSVSACTTHNGRPAAEAPNGGSPRALTVEPTDVILGQRPTEAPLATPSVHPVLVEDAAKLSREERLTRQAAQNAALSRAGRIGSKSVGQSARWSSLNR